MKDHTNPTDMSNFEAATIREGSRVDVVFRRRGPVILDRLTPPARQAVETYTATAEAVAAGGATMPRDSLAGAGCQGGTPSKDGRQAGVVDQVAFLRRMEAAVGQEAIMVGRRDPLPVRPLDLWRAVCLGDVAMEAFLRKRGLAPAKSRMAALNEGFLATADRVADAIGATRSPWT